MTPIPGVHHAGKSENAAPDGRDTEIAELKRQLSEARSDLLSFQIQSVQAQDDSIKVSKNASPYHCLIVNSVNPIPRAADGRSIQGS